MLDCHQLKSIHVIFHLVPSTLSHAVFTFLYAVAYALTTILFFLVYFGSLPRRPIHLIDISSTKYAAEEICPSS